MNICTQLKVLGSLLNCISIDQYSQLMFQEFLFRLLRNSIFLESSEGKLVWQRPWSGVSIEGWVADVRLAGLFLTQLNLRMHYVHVCTLQLKCRNETARPSLLARQLSTLSWSMCLQSSDTWSSAYRSIACKGNKCSPKGASGQFARCIAYTPHNETDIEYCGLLYTSFSALKFEG